jgi:hypothetical protein
VDDGHAPVTPRLRPGLLAGLIATFVLTTAVGAQSPLPSRATSSPTPSAATTPADCGQLVGLLPPSLDDQPLDATATSGVAAIDPDELLDPLLGSLGRARADVCVVAFRYGGASRALAGQLLRISGAESGDLAERFVDALRERLVAYGAQASPSSLQAAGRPVWSLDVTADDQRSQVVAAQLDDIVLLTTGLDAMDRLLPLLVVDLTPSPSTAVPSPSVVPASPAD